MKCGLLVVPLNLVLSIVLILKLGLIGACIGTTISLIIGTVFLLKMFHNYLNKPFKEISEFICKPVLIAVFSGLLIMPIDNLADFLKSMSLRESSLLILLIKGVIFCFIYIYVALVIKFIDKGDLKLLKLQLSFLRRFLH